MNTNHKAFGPGLQQTLAEMVTAAAAMSPALWTSSDTVATSELSDVVSAAACAVAAFTAASTSAGVGATFADREAASFDTAATADLRAEICVRRDAAAAGTLAPAAATLADPDRVAATPEATREQLLVAMGYAAARVALSPLRAAPVPDVDDALIASSAALVLSTRDRAASVFSAAARAGSVVAGAVTVVDAVVDGDEVVDVVDDVVVDEDVLGGVPSFELHPPRRQMATAVDTSVLLRIARTPHHIVGRAPAHPRIPRRRRGSNPAIRRAFCASPWRDRPNGWEPL